MTSSRKELVCAVSIISLTMAASVAHAQTEAASGSGAATSSLGEIVVTAEKRTENVQRTPVAITTVDQTTLTQAGVNGFNNLQKLVPDVKVQRWEGAEVIAVRGLASGDTSPTGESANAVFIDGAYLAKAQALSGAFYDIAHIEVLKGPQGTLYGRNATGGAINLITNRPTSRFGGNAEVEIGNYHLVRTEGALNIPVTDTLAIRGAFQTYSHSGYQKSGFADADEKSGRISALWKPTSADTVYVSGDLTHVGGIYPGMLQVVALTPGKTGVIPSDPQDDTAAPPNGYGDAHGHYSTDEKQGGLNFQYDHDFGWATSTLQATYRSSDADDWNPGTNPVGEADHAPARFNDVTLEARLASNSSRPLQWVVGAFYLHENDYGYNAQYSSSTNVSDGGLGFNFVNAYQHAKSYAVFGQATYTPDFLQQLHIVLGARETWDDKTGETYTLNGPQAGSGCPCYVPGAEPNAGRLKYDAFNYKAGLSFDLTDRSMIYGNISTGYKAGGFGYGSTPIYRPEYITAYEIGSKNRFFDNKLQVNAEGFLYKYRDFEETLAFFIPSLRTVYASTVNAGHATYKGVTIDVQYLLTPNDRVSWNGIWSSGRFRDNNLTLLVPPVYAAVAGPHDLSNTSILEIPRMAGTFSYDHIWEALNGTFDAQVAGQYRGVTPLAAANQNTAAAWYYNGHPWVMFDLSVRYDASGDNRWSLTGYVHNVANRHEVIYGQGSGNSTYITGAYAAPRTFGFILAAKF